MKHLDQCLFSTKNQEGLLKRSGNGNLIYCRENFGSRQRTKFIWRVEQLEFYLCIGIVFFPLKSTFRLKQKWAKQYGHLRVLYWGL